MEMPENKNSHNSNQCETGRFLSRNLESLVSEIAKKRSDHPDARISYDVVIVGSGYGGAMAAAELAKLNSENSSTPLKICLLERGKEYLPGMFPNKMSELPRQIRFSTTTSSEAQGTREGLFDFRLGEGVSTLIANGLGGGSLINAGVMETPTQDCFATGWPKAITQDPELLSYYDSAKEALGASLGGRDNTIETHPKHEQNKLKKFIAVKQLSRPVGPDVFRPAALTVAMNDKTTSGNVDLKECILCGDCATGCNFHAKESLDTNLLVKAKGLGMEIYTGASVYKVKQAHSKGWTIEIDYTNKNLSERNDIPIEIDASHVILAAGALGSSEILMRSQSDALKFSPKLGSHFSSNGDMIAASFNQKIEANAVARQSEAPIERRVGPTITGVVDLRKHQNKGNILVEEMAVPAALEQLFSETVTTLSTLHNLATPDTKKHRANNAEDPLSVSRDKIQRTSLYALMGDDDADGVLRLDESEQNACEGNIKIVWPDLPDKPLFKKQMEVLENLVSTPELAGQALPNGLWRPLPEAMNYLTNNVKGPLMTVHPLGGCPMANSVSDGVVNHLGQVFNAMPQGEGDSLHQGLYVLDASIIPKSLGTNPALSIAALSLRAIRTLIARSVFDCNLPHQYPVQTTELPKGKRPEYRNTSNATLSDPTQVDVTERLVGKISLADRDYVLELTLKFAPKNLKDMTRPFVLNLSPETSSNTRDSTIRIFETNTFHDIEKQYRSHAEHERKLDEAALFIAPISGSLDVFGRESSGYRQRQVRGLYSWLLNRGARDSYQWFEGHGFCSLVKQGGSRLSNALNLASRAGEVRLFQYNLRIGEPVKFASGALSRHLSGKTIEGKKSFTYNRRANPWRQLQEMQLTSFPGMDKKQDTNVVLSLDTKYLARIGIPLLEFSGQDNQVNALADLASFFAYLFRLCINIHSWTFRLPDQPSQKPPKRFPGKMPGMPDPVIKELYVGSSPQGQPVQIRLTRYPRYNSKHPPLLMIHGYSVSGNTFLHPQVDPNLASYFYQKERDIWIVDLRTSSAMPTAQLPWRFEDVAFYDIPVAVDYIYRQTGYRPIDILAHCMGAAMFSMAVLGTYQSSEEPEPDGIPTIGQMRESLSSRIRKAAFSQVGPAPVFSPANIFRGYITHYFSHLIDQASYSFQVSDHPSLAEQLFDRLLYSLPYPEEEFDIENPPFKFWEKRRFVSTRHRMDALYGRDFNLINIEPKLYDYFDDLFGPLSLKTVNQVTHFSRLSLITDHLGNNRYVHRNHFENHWNFPTLSFHGSENGLVDPITADRLTKLIKIDAGIETYEAIPIEKHGHQDCLIGKDRVKAVYEKLAVFFESEEQTDDEQPGRSTLSRKEPQNTISGELCANTPWLGPILGSTSRATNGICFRFNQDPVYHRPIVIATFAVERQGLMVVPAMDDGGDDLFLALLSKLQLRPNCELDWQTETYSISDLPDGASGIATLLISDDSERLSSLNFLFQKNNEIEVWKLIQTLQLQLISSGPNGLSIDTMLASIDSQESGSPELLVGLIELLKLVGKAIRSMLADRNKEVFDHCIWLDRLSRVNRATMSGGTAAPKPSDSFTFAMASCQYPAGMLDGSLAFDSYKRLSTLVSSSEAPSPDMLLLLGDQIYADASAGLFDPLSYENRFVLPYQKLFLNPHVKAIAKSIPIHTMLDDHEIIDNYEPVSDQAKSKKLDRLRSQGVEAFLRFQRQNTAPPATQTLWQELTHYVQAPIFIADTRTERELRTAENIRSARIMNEEQFDALCSFLLTHKNDQYPTFVASPSSLLPRHLVSHDPQEEYPANCIRSDAWDGYPRSLYELLSFILENEIQNVIFLSGDEHVSSVCNILLSDSVKQKAIHCYSIHSSALYAPYPFANSKPEDLLQHDRFFFKNNQYLCEADTAFYPGDGFALLSVKQLESSWEVHCRFNRKSTDHQEVILKPIRQLQTEGG